MEVFGPDGEVEVSRCFSKKCGSIVAFSEERSFQRNRRHAGSGQDA
jgi:hypothetical protein